MSSKPNPTSDPVDQAPRTDGSVWLQRLLVALFLLAAVATSASFRIQTALDDPNFDRHDARSMLRSDPGLLYYFTDQIVQAGGGIPDDFTASRHIEYPAERNLLEMFSIGQEFVVAWAKLFFGEGTPLHIVALWTMSIFASTILLSVFGLAFELTRNRWWAMLATLLALLMLGNYRTLGFILIREDFAMPWLGLHLYALARAARLRTRGSIALGAVAFVLAAATWHAMGFMLTIEASILLAWFLRTGDNPLRTPGAWLFPAIVAVGTLSVPVLRSKGFLFSLPMLILAGLGVAAWLEGREGLNARLKRVAPLVVIALLVLITPTLSRLLFGAAGDYSHVFEFMMAKVRFLGQRPEDPTLLSYDTRLLWQGPFVTPSVEYFTAALGVGLFALLFAAIWGGIGWWRGAGDRSLLLLCGLGIAGVVAALLVQRTVILPTLASPVIAVAALQRIRMPALRGVLIAGGLAAQALAFQGWITTYRSPWYLPPERNKELADVVRWIEANVPVKQPIATDFTTGTAVLAHAGNPMLLQPKYETTSSRRRIETFNMAFGHKTLAEYDALLAENECRFVLTNFHYWSGRFYELGFVPSPTWTPPKDSPFYWFCHFDPNVYRNIPGYELVYQSPDRFGKDYFRLYRRRGPRNPAR